MWADLDQIIGLSVEQRDRLHALDLEARTREPERFARLYGFFAASADVDRGKLSYLFHHHRDAHEAERLACLANLDEALRQVGDGGLWAPLFLYHGWGHLMVRRIERRLAGAARPQVAPSAFVYAMF